MTSVDDLMHCGKRAGHLYCVLKPQHGGWHQLAAPGSRDPEYFLLEGAVTVTGDEG